ncbi:MAG: extracellular solute-binding protein [Lachnospiraceae bacterium]|jgi:raffinose/stachyose/melibiose transport system substrate-binding protein|nr:extracellular solute-binding protein [Lachnospiraceae bacterium]
MKMNRVMAVVLAGAMALGLAACGGSATASTAASGSSTAASGKGITLLNGKPEIDTQLQSLAKTYQEKSGVTVTVVTVGGSNQATASDTLKKDYQAGTMPDIFVSEANQFANWKGKLADLTSEKWVSNTDLAYKEDSKVYGFPYMVEGWGLAYNADILEKAGIDATKLTSPAAYKTAFETLESKKSELGLTAVVDYGANNKNLGWSTGTHIFGQYLDAGIKSGEDSKYFDMLQDGGQIDETRMTDFANFIDLIQQHCDKDIATNGTYDQETALFAQGKAAFVTQGSWFGANLTASTDYSKFKCGIAPFAFEDGIDTICGGATSYWAVYGDGNVDAAKAFLQWCSEADAQKIFVNDCGFVSPYKTVTDVPSDPFASSIKSYMDNGKFSNMNTFMKKDGLQNETGQVFEDFAKGNLDAAKFVTTIEQVIKSYYAS